MGIQLMKASASISVNFASFCVKIEPWIKSLNQFQKNGHFRAFVLDSTETVREAQKRHQTWPTSTVALGRTLIAAQILGANEKGEEKNHCKSPR